MSDYNVIVRGQVRKKFTTPFMMAAQLCMAVTLQQISQNKEILFVFDQNKGSESAMVALKQVVFRFRMENLRPGEIVPAFAAKSWNARATVVLDDNAAAEPRRPMVYLLVPHTDSNRLGSRTLCPWCHSGHLVRSMPRNLQCLPAVQLRQALM